MLVHILKVLEQISSIKTIPILFENFLEVHLKWGLPLSFLQPGAEVLQSFPAGQDSIKMLQPNSADSHSARKWTPPAPLTIHFSIMMTIFAQYCVHLTCLHSVQAIIIRGLASWSPKPLIEPRRAHFRVSAPKKHSCNKKWHCYWQKSTCPLRPLTLWGWPCSRWDWLFILGGLKSLKLKA